MGVHRKIQEGGPKNPVSGKKNYLKLLKIGLFLLKTSQIQRFCFLEGKQALLSVQTYSVSALLPK